MKKKNIKFKLRSAKRAGVEMCGMKWNRAEIGRCRSAE